jgi:hypothetical protein
VKYINPLSMLRAMPLRACAQRLASSMSIKQNGLHLSLKDLHLILPQDHVPAGVHVSFFFDENGESRRGK